MKKITISIKLQRSLGRNKADVELDFSDKLNEGEQAALCATLSQILGKLHDEFGIKNTIFDPKRIIK